MTELWVNPNVGSEWTESNGTYTLNSSGAFSELGIVGLDENKSYIFRFTVLSINSRLRAEYYTTNGYTAAVENINFVGDHVYVLPRANRWRFTRMSGDAPTSQLSNISVKEINLNTLDGAVGDYIVDGVEKLLVPDDGELLGRIRGAADYSAAKSEVLAWLAENELDSSTYILSPEERQALYAFNPLGSHLT